MASMLHEGLLALFRNRPTFAPELLQDALGLDLPAWSEVRVESAEFTQVVPTEYRADLVVLLLDGKPIFAIVVEVQLSRDYVDLAVSSLSEAARRALEGLMKSGKYEYQTEFVRKWIAQGLEQGRQQGEVEFLLEVLDARGLEVDDAARQQIMACKDLAQLKLWLRKAVTARSTQELFDSKPA